VVDSHVTSSLDISDKKKEEKTELKPSLSLCRTKQENSHCSARRHFSQDLIIFFTALLYAYLQFVMHYSVLS